MIDLCLCVEMFLPKMKMGDRIRYAADLGFKAVEFTDPTDLDSAEIASASRQSGMDVAMCCIRDVFDHRLSLRYPVLLKAVKETIESMKKIGCRSMFILSGDVEGRYDSQKNIIIENLKRLAELAEKEDITINIEPVNSLIEIKGHYLDSPAVGFEILKCVNSSHIKMLYDVYHAQMMEGNVIATITKNIQMISHFHSAAVPGRKELFLGELDYRNIIRAIEAAGFCGYFSLEYVPSYQDHKKSLNDVLCYLRS